jgi:hypothetical protein
MDSVAISSKEDRQALFGETGAALGVANTIAEGLLGLLGSEALVRTSKRGRTDLSLQRRYLVVESFWRNPALL